MSLLRPSADARPSAREVLALVEGEAAVVPRVAFHGRERELKRIDALVDDDDGRLVLVEGPSGIGKTALMRRSCRRAASAGALVLEGRCVARASTAFKALDSVVDGLSRVLLRDEDAAQRIAPSDARAILTLFPVLRRVPRLAARALEGANESGAEARRSARLRQRAARALRTLLCAVQGARPLLLWIDDVHWSDVDSAPLLAQVLRPEVPERWTVVLASRPEAPRANALVDATRVVDVERIALKALDDEVADEILLKLAPDASDEALQEAREAAGGSPLRLRHLGALLRRPADEARFDPEPSFSLAPPSAGTSARALLDCIACCNVAAPRALVESLDDDGDFPALVTSGLLQPVADRHGLVVELVHAQLREGLLKSLAPDRKAAHHLRLAELFSEVPDIDPSVLAFHFAEAGETSRLAAPAERAAERAFEQLAFARAAQLFALVSDANPSRDDDVGFVRRHAEAHAAAGDAKAAAQLFLRAASLESRDDDRRRAAELLIGAGHLDEGIEVLDDALKDVGMSLKKGRTLSGLLYERAALKFTKEGRASTPGLLKQVDVCWTVSGALGTFDAMGAFGFQSKHLRLALRAGEPKRLARALAMERIYVGSTGKQAARARELDARVATLLEDIDDPVEIAFHRFAHGYAEFLQGNFREGRELLLDAGARYEEVGSVCWEQNLCSNMLLIVLDFLGAPRVLAKEAHELLETYRARDDRLGAANLGLGAAYIAELYNDRPERAEALVDDALAQFGRAPLTIEYLALVARTRIDLYRDMRERAQARLEAGLSTVKRMRAFQNARYMLDWLTALVTGGSARARAVRRMQREDGGWGASLPSLFSGDKRVQLEAVAELESRAMTLYSAGGRARVAGHERGAREAARAFHDAGAHDPEAFARIYGAP